MKKRRYFSWVLLLSLLLGVFGCTAPTDVIPAQTGDASEGAPTEVLAAQAVTKPKNPLTIAKNGSSAYQVVCSINASDELTDECDEIIDSINAATGATLARVDDITGAEQKCEILIGDVLRIDAQNAISGNDIYDMCFLIGVTNEKVMILGVTELATRAAISYFLKNVLYVDEATKTVSLEKDAFYVFDPTAPVGVKVLSTTDTAVTFRLDEGGAAQCDCRVTYTGNSGWRIQTGEGGGSDFSDIGAAQLLSYSVGEEFVNTVEKITVATQGTNVVMQAADGSRAVLSTTEFLLNFYTPNNRTAATITSITANENGSYIAGTLEKGEAIFGTGERFNSVNQRGKRIEMYTADIWDKDYANYMAIPLLCSSRGSGLFINRYEYMTLDLGQTDSDVWTATVDVGPMDCYVFTTEQIADVIYGYSALSGFAEMPEEWTYGMIVCRLSPDLSQKYGGEGERKGQKVTYEGVYDVIEKMEKYDLPWTGILAEGWGPYNSSKHRDLKELCDYVHSLGKKFLVYIRVGEARSSMGGYAEGYLLSRTNPDGSRTVRLPDTTSGVMNPDVGADVDTHVYLDVTNPAAVEWFFNEYWEYLSNEIGVDGAKIDFCETLPENYELNYYDENIPTKGSHHWYPTAFCTMFWDMISSKPDSGMCYSRGGGIGSQRNPFMWAGDQCRQYSRLEFQVKAILSSGLSGVPFMSYDMAGYKYNANDNPIPIQEESGIFIRGTQFTAFTVCMQTHGWVRTPYDFAMEGDSFTTDIYRAYNKLHEALTPYITEYSQIACDTGLPVMRHMVLHWQDDPNVYGIENQYMFGDAFLVAPVLNSRTQRDIYLPEGKWKDLNTGEIYEVPAGGRELKNYSVPMTDLPVFYNMETDSQTAEGLLSSITEVFAYVKTLK